MPVTVTYFGSVAAVTQHWNDPTKDYKFAHRFTYSSSLLIARKFTPRLSLQVSPNFVHRNLVEKRTDPSNMYAVEVGGRYKLGRLISINSEYYYLLPVGDINGYRNALSIGFDIETGGHVFQLFFSNTQGIVDKNFITETRGEWLKGDIFFGFNLSRFFYFGDHKPK